MSRWRDAALVVGVLALLGLQVDGYVRQRLAIEAEAARVRAQIAAEAAPCWSVAVITDVDRVDDRRVAIVGVLEPASGCEFIALSAVLVDRAGEQHTLGVGWCDEPYRSCGEAVTRPAVKQAFGPWEIWSETASPAGEVTVFATHRRQTPRTRALFTFEWPEASDDSS